MSQNGQAGISQSKNRQAAKEAEGRGQLAELRQKLMGDATRQMLEAAHLKPGNQSWISPRGQATRADRQQGWSGGSVLATDISQEMLNVAARQAREDGLSNITTRVMNAEQHDLAENSYDAAIWWGDKYNAILGTLEPEPRQHLLEEIRRARRAFEGPQGIQAPEEFLLGVGIK